MSRNTDPIAEALAEALPQLKHPGTGKTFMFAGLGAESMRGTRLQLAESIIAWFQDNGHMPKPKPGKKAIR